MRIVILGLSITSSWGSGHATTYRCLVRALADRGHDLLFLERDKPWYAANRDLPVPPYGRTILYGSVAGLQEQHAAAVRNADLVIVGSYVPDGIAVGAWVLATAGGVTAFYDIDTPITLAALARGDCAYLSTDLIPRYRLYLSFTGGPTLDLIRERFGARLVRPLYCAVDPELYYPASDGAPDAEDVPTDERTPPHPTAAGVLLHPAAPPVGARRPEQGGGLQTRYDLGYLGTYSADRQPALERLLIEAARQLPERRFAVAGAQFPEDIIWPANVSHTVHLSPREHRAFYNAQRFTLSVTRADMIAAGYSPSVRLFEAAACATPVITDPWPGLEEFFRPGTEILVAETTTDVLRLVREMPEAERLAIGQAARTRALDVHTGAHRAAVLERYVREAHPGE
jgi:spore maturation protein CgeB